MPSLPALPVDAFVPEILAVVRSRRATVVTAAPGAGKTTRLAPALTADGPVLLLQPRRVAARSIARHIAREQGWEVGGQVGWQVRFERRFGPHTRLLVATEGILTARAQADPLLSDFVTIVLDEFHERSLHADLALALAKQAWLARDDLRIVVMSATLEVDPVARFLGDCPVVQVPGRLHPLDVRYLPGHSLADATDVALRESTGSVLCFLAGAPEIRRAEGELASVASRHAVEVLPLHGSLSAEAQDEAIREVATRRVILATNLAETSLTVPGVTAVVDSGFHKLLRYDATRGIDRLDTERVSAASADQRAGRAGRVAPGMALRLWDARDRLRPRTEPEIVRVDLCGLALDVLGWGGDPRAFDWFESPPREALDAALGLLETLGAIEGGRLTTVGSALNRLPLHPRLGRILLAASGARDAARACALLSERSFGAPRVENASCDLLGALDAWETAPWSLQHAAREIDRLARSVAGVGRGPQEDANSRRMDEEALRRALFAGYPDRVARRREPRSSRLLLASGYGAVLARESGVRDAEFLVALDVQGGQAEALVHLASAVERDWLTPSDSTTDHRFDSARGTVRAFETTRYGAIVLDERVVPADRAVVADLLAKAYLERPRSDEDEQWLRRLRFAAIDVDIDAMVKVAAREARSIDELSLASALPRSVMGQLDRLAPARLPVPSGRTAALTYREDGGVEASVKLQELFGLARTPRLGPRQEPVLFALLAPNGRPVQVTRDLESFWNTGYTEVRKELRGRYPRHPWPEDPWTAHATGRTKKRDRGSN